MVGLLEVDYERSCRAYREGEPVYREPFQAACPELVLELLLCRVPDESPFVEPGDIVAGKLLLHGTQQVSAYDELRRPEGRKQRTDIVCRALGHLEGSGGDVEEGRPALLALEGESGQEVVFLLVQETLAEGYAGCEYFRHAPLYELGLREVGVFELVADSDLVAGADQFLQVAFYRMVRKTGHFGAALVAVRALGQHQTEHLACGYGIVGVGLVEVSHPVEQDGLGILRLDAEILPEQRCVFSALCHRLQS